MKRKTNLYQNIYNEKNIFQAYKEVCRNTKNKRKVEKYKSNMCANIANISYILKNELYIMGKLNVFTLYEPKKRTIVSQDMDDKIVNHLVARYILFPALLPCLEDFNVASRKNMGMKVGLEIYNKSRRYFELKYKTYYMLKCDIKYFFASIDREILKKKI